MRKILVEEPEGRIPLGRQRLKWENDIKIDLKQMGWESVEFIYLAKDRDCLRVDVNTVMNLRVH
jgi:hypothetical protein